MSEGFLSPSKRPFITKLCIVGSYLDENLIQELRTNHSCEIIHAQNATECNELLDDPEVVFLLNDFESDDFTALQRLTEKDKKTSYQPPKNLKFIGPAILRSHISKELRTPRVNRPQYCEIMKDVIVVLGDEVQHKRQLIDLLHFMSGRVRKDASPRTQILVADRVLTRNYKLASCLSACIVTPEYISKCWANRDNLTFDVLNPELIREFALGTFEQLKIGFCGFLDEESDEMMRVVKINKGIVVDDLADANVIVCHPTDAMGLKLYTKQVAVTEEWLWSSVHAQRSLSEEPYLPTQFSGQSRKSFGTPMDCGRRSKSSVHDLDISQHSLLNATPDYVYSTDDLEALESPKKLDKKQQVCHEMLETENNYMNAVRVLLKFRDVIVDEVGKPGQEGLIKRDEIALIFGKLPAILECHNKIHDALKIMVENWKPSHDIAKVWIDAHDELSRCYPPYINSYDSAVQMLEDAYMKSSKFYSFVRSKESNPEFKRNSLKELLIRPVQRLPSVILLLREIHKRSEKLDHLKYVNKRLEDAVHSVNKVLERANNMRATADNKIAHLQRFTQVDDVPADLVCSRRNFIGELDGYAIAGMSLWQKTARKNIRIILFNDMMVVCKIRSAEPQTVSVAASPSGTLSRMVRQSSFSFLKPIHKPYKYLIHTETHHIRSIRVVKQSDDDFESASPLGESPVYALTIRCENSADNCWVMQPGDDYKWQKVVKYVDEQSFLDYGRAVRHPPVALSELIHNNEEMREALDRYKRKKRTWFMMMIHKMTTFFRPDEQCSWHWDEDELVYMDQLFMTGPSIEWNADVTRISGGSSRSSKSSRTSKMSRAQGANQTMNATSMPRPGGFRRALSHASMTVAHRLTKMTASRTNLRNINENSPVVEMNPAPDLSPLKNSSSDNSNGTPKRGIRSRITSSTFMRAALMRRESVRQPPMNHSSEDKENCRYPRV